MNLLSSGFQVSPPRGRDKRHHWRAPIPSLSVQPLGSADWAWLVKRLYKLCVDLCNSYIQMHRDLESTLEEAALLRGGGAGGDHVFFLPLFQSETSIPTSAGGLSARGTPSETADMSTASPGDTPTPSSGFRSESIRPSVSCPLLHFQGSSLERFDISFASYWVNVLANAKLAVLCLKNNRTGEK